MYCVNRLVIITSEKDRVSKGTLNTHDFRQVLQYLSPFWREAPNLTTNQRAPN